MSRNTPKPASTPLPRDVRIAIVAARFNSHIVDKLLAGCTERLKELKIPSANIAIHQVPGAFELPLAAKLLARTQRFDSVICLGCVIRGDTPHFDYVAGECAGGIQQVAIDECLPIIFGVLTTENEKQARERTGGKHGHAGVRAAEAAAEMILLSRRIGK